LQTLFGRASKSKPTRLRAQACDAQLFDKHNKFCYIPGQH
jgi:hypothetical protein